MITSNRRVERRAVKH